MVMRRVVSMEKLMVEWTVEQRDKK